MTLKRWMAIWASKVDRNVIHILINWVEKGVCLPNGGIMFNILGRSWCWRLDLALFSLGTEFTSSIWIRCLAPSETTFKCIQTFPSLFSIRVLLVILDICFIVCFPDLTAVIQNKLICEGELITDCKCTFQCWTVWLCKELRSNLFWTLEQRRPCGWPVKFTWTGSIKSEVARHFKINKL